MGEEAPLGGADGHMLSGAGDPRGEGNGEGGAAAFTGGIWDTAAGLAFFLGGAEGLTPDVASTPSIMSKPA